MEKNKLQRYLLAILAVIAMVILVMLFWYNTLLGNNIWAILYAVILFATALCWEEYYNSE